MDAYFEVISLIERLHRQFLELVKLELDGLGIHDINNVQGMMLFNIGDAEMTVGELTLRGCYLGSNVSYNLKKMVENGYLVQERSVHDRRSIHVRLTDKGRDLRDRLSGMHKRHVEMLSQTVITEGDLQGVVVTLRRLERFWMRASDLLQRPGNPPPKQHALFRESRRIHKTTVNPSAAFTLLSIANRQKPETPQHCRGTHPARCPGHRLSRQYPADAD